MAQSLRAISAESTFDPHANLMDKLAANPTGVQSAAEVDTSPLTNPKCPDPNEPDSDSDGVNNCLETQVWMTNPNNPDSDEPADRLSGDWPGHTLKATTATTTACWTRWRSTGFSANGILSGTQTRCRWTATATGCPSDQRGGSVENGSSARDTDGDGVPYFYDTDNDNDGVPDGTDMSPCTRGPCGRRGHHGANNPRQPRLTGFENGRMAYFDLQLRPATTITCATPTAPFWIGPWDRKGQVQDWDNATFAQTWRPGATSPRPAQRPHRHDGDMRLTPNLEISIAGTNSADLSQYHLPPQSALAPYNINVITSTDGTPFGAPNGVKLYVPITLVTHLAHGHVGCLQRPHPLSGHWCRLDCAPPGAHGLTLQMLQDIPWAHPTDDHAYASGCLPHPRRQQPLPRP